MITPAFAQGAGAAGGMDVALQLVPFVLIFVIILFITLGTTNKKATRATIFIIVLVVVILIIVKHTWVHVAQRRRQKIVANNIHRLIA